MNLPSAIRFYTFWAINDTLDQNRLRRQMDQFRAAGFDGVVWHPRFFPNDPPYLGERYLQEVSDVILYAKCIGLAFWIYDEDGWPSGTAGGQLLKLFPQDAQRWADLVTEKPERCLVEFEHDGKKWFLAERIGAGVDYFSPGLAQHFIQLTHERYRNGLAPEAWDHVEAFFCDEPEFGLGHAYDLMSKHGAIPWTPKLPELFHAKHGEDLLPLIAKLFFNGDGAAGVRVKFWELLTDIFNESFTAAINQWCAQHGKRFVAHLKGEEHPLFQVPTNGSCHQFFRNLSLPGIDALERFPGNNFYPRQVSAAARQFGNGRCMVEAFGGAGWGATPEDLERYLLWLGCNGLTDFVMHLSQYRLDSAAMHDWPPSQPLHLTWRDAYPEVLARVRRELGQNPRPPADTLVIAPNRGIMANYAPQEFLQTNVHNAATYPDTVAGSMNRKFLECVEKMHRAGVNYDIADERTLEQFGKADSGKIALGNCAYRRVIVPEGCELNSATRGLVQPFSCKTTVSSTTRIEHENRAGLEIGTPIAISWSLEKHPLNTLLLEAMMQTDGTFTAHFETAVESNDAPLQLVFADDISSLAVNGKTLSLEKSDECSFAKIPRVESSGVNSICFLPVKKVERPFVWLKGFFRVQSRAPFTVGPNQTVKTQGPFAVDSARNELLENLIADGFPFLQAELTVSAEVELPTAILFLRFDGVEADAVHLSVDGNDFGWTWRTDGEIKFATKLAAGKHRLQLRLVPNTFNGFGPHHYFAGDWHVVSPDQIRGVKNFADAPDAPLKTHVAAWHFRKFQLPKTISMFA